MVGIVGQLAPSGKKTDWEPFYGFGGGVEFNVLKYASLRMQADFVHNDLFTDILKNSRNTVRLTEAQKEELLVAYQRSIYTALREVSDALIGLDRLREQRSQANRQHGCLVMGGDDHS